ncbi:MAG: dethiobiotin synthase [Gammaproteobacteria bacterium]|nr:dethiobiotin synthase [Gammaproteobacteria bacterium]
MSGLFITGTDTEIGKTFVSSILIKIIAEEGYKVIGMKPVASGAKNVNGILKNDDALSLIQASNVDADYTNVNPYVFEPAVSPHIAAEQAGIEINLDEIKKCFSQLQKKSDVVVVEGVGGWYAPLSTHTTVADLAESLKLPIIIVVGLRLGCLNHALLTVEAIRKSGLSIAGWVANHVEKDFSFAEKNIKTLKEYFNDFPFLGSVYYQTNLNNKLHQQHLNKKTLIEKLRIKK